MLVLNWMKKHFWLLSCRSRGILADRKQPLPAPSESDASLPYEVSNIRNYSLAVTGDVFRWIIEYGNEEVLRRVSLESYSKGCLAWEKPPLAGD